MPATNLLSSNRWSKHVERSDTRRNGIRWLEHEEPLLTDKQARATMRRTAAVRSPLHRQTTRTEMTKSNKMMRKMSDPGTTNLGCST